MIIRCIVSWVEHKKGNMVYSWCRMRLGMDTDKRRSGASNDPLRREEIKAMSASSRP